MMKVRICPIFLYIKERNQSVRTETEAYEEVFGKTRQEIYKEWVEYLKR